MSEGSGQRFCGNCGAEIRSGTSFCVSCGQQVEGSEERTEANASFGTMGSGPTGGSSLNQQNIRLGLLGVGALLLAALAYLILSYSVTLGLLLTVLMALAVLVIRKNRGLQTRREQQLFNTTNQYKESARRAYEEGKHREIAQNAYQQSRRVYEEANTRYQSRSEQKAAERERIESLRTIQWKRDERINRFDQYQRFFQRASEGSRDSLDWWRAYDTGEFDDEQAPVSNLLLSAQNRAERGLGRLREMESTLSDMLEREEFNRADLLLNGVEAGQANFEGEESVFSPLVAVHERIKGAEGWTNYRGNLEKFVKDLEDLLGSPNVRTAPANRVRFPDPDRPHPSATARTQFPNPYTGGQTASRFCQRCGADNAPQAAFCLNCGGNLQQAATSANPSVASGGYGVIVSGYVFALLAFLILPIIFATVAIALGAVNITRGDTGHGVVQILIAAFAALLGLLLGGIFFY